MKLPMGRLGSLKPARLRRMALETRRTASSWPTTRSLSRSGMCTSFWISPSIMRGHRNAGPLGHDAGDIVLADFLLEQRVFLDRFQLLLGGLDVLFDLREAAVAQLRGLFPIAGAAGLFLFLAQRVLLLLELAHAADGALLAVPALSSERPLRRAAAPARFRPARSRSCEAGSVSLPSAWRSISRCEMRRSRSSISIGMEPICRRSAEPASSIRSMALSGRKRSAM